MHLVEDNCPFVVAFFIIKDQCGEGWIHVSTMGLTSIDYLAPLVFSYVVFWTQRTKVSGHRKSFGICWSSWKPIIISVVHKCMCQLIINKLPFRGLFHSK